MIADSERRMEFVDAVVTDQFDFLIVVGGKPVQADYRRLAKFVDVLDMLAFGNPSVVDRIDNAKRPLDVLGPEFELFGYAGLGLFMGIIVVIIGGIQTIRFKIKSKRSFTKK